MSPDRRRALLNFNYSEAQWSEIEKSVQHLKFYGTSRYLYGAVSDPQHGPYLLSEFPFAPPRPFREQLLEIIRRFAQSSSRGDVTRRIRKDHAEWVKIEALSAELSRLIDSRSREEGPPNPYSGRYEEFDGYLSMLTEVRNLALKSLDSAQSRLRDHLTSPDRTSRTPRVWFQSRVLEVWTNLGGKLRYSRHQRSRKITGPLLRYFTAVTQPIIGGSPESLPDAIDRQQSLMADQKLSWRAVREDYYAQKREQRWRYQKKRRR